MHANVLINLDVVCYLLCCCFKVIGFACVFMFAINILADLTCICSWFWFWVVIVVVVFCFSLLDVCIGSY